jgi:DNA-binding NtrC family response regulator
MERKDDIPLLSTYFLSRFAEEAGMASPGISREAMAVLADHAWPGNVRELANTIQKALIFNRGAPVSPEDINQAVREEGKGKDTEEGAEMATIRKWVRSRLDRGGSDRLFDVCLDRIGGIIISEALSMTGGNRSKAAKLLGLSRPTLHSKIEKYRLKFETSVTEAAKQPEEET